jgi:hypothetical protein
LPVATKAVLSHPTRWLFEIPVVSVVVAAHSLDCFEPSMA